MQSHEIDYKIIGHDVQLVEVELDPGENRKLRKQEAMLLYGRRN